MAAMNQPIQLISTFGTNGEIKPLWFRFESTTHEIETVRIAEVVSCKEACHCGISYLSFVCWSEAEAWRHLVEIRYYLETHQWKLFRMLS